MEQVVSGTLARQRFLLLLFGIFAGLALLLACIGIYGVLAYLTSQRVPEIGVRMALGANAGDVMWLVLRQSLAMILAGVGVGIAAALVSSRASIGAPGSRNAAHGAVDLRHYGFRTGGGCPVREFCAGPPRQPGRPNARPAARVAQRPIPVYRRLHGSWARPDRAWAVDFRTGRDQAWQRRAKDPHGFR